MYYAGRHMTGSTIVVKGCYYHVPYWGKLKSLISNNITYNNLAGPTGARRVRVIAAAVGGAQRFAGQGYKSPQGPNMRRPH